MAAHSPAHDRPRPSTYSIASTNVVNNTPIPDLTQYLKSDSRIPLSVFFQRGSPSIWRWLEICGLTLTILPIRLTGMLCSFLSAWVTSKLSIIGMDQEELDARPLEGWRSAIRWFGIAVFMRLFWFFVGFHWVKVTGTPATREQAPLLVAAPHSSVFDSIVMNYIGPLSVVCRIEDKEVPLMGVIVKSSQSIYVNRNDPNSRQSTVAEIRRRVTEPGWLQVYIYPEGTCTNRAGLAIFRPGAFGPVVPVQPIVIRYLSQGEYDSFSWVFDGPNLLAMVFHSFTHYNNCVHVHFLPVYTPNEEEKKNPVLFMENVRTLMAKALGVPKCPWGFADGAMMRRIKESKIPRNLQKLHSQRKALRIPGNVEQQFLHFQSEEGVRITWHVNLEEFGSILQVDMTNPKLRQHVETIFELYTVKAPEGDGTIPVIDMREYIFFVACLNPEVTEADLVKYLFWSYTGAANVSSSTEMDEDTFTIMFNRLFGVSKETGQKLYQAGKVKKMTKEVFHKKLVTRMVTLRLNGLEVLGLMPEVYPPRSEHDQYPEESD